MTKHSDDPALIEARQEGAKAQSEGVPRGQCPHIDPDLQHAWGAGWDASKREAEGATPLTDAWDAGAAARYEGIARSKCPYTDPDLRDAWREGWDDSDDLSG